MSFDNYKFKTEPRGKQIDVLRESWDKQNWAFLCRPGTGKTKLGLDTAGMLWLADRIDAMLVMAPDGVDRQWVEEGVPKHLSDQVPRIVGNYNSNMGKLAFAKLERNMLGANGERALRILTISFDGLQTPRGRKLAGQFVARYATLTDDDESHRTSNKKAAGYKAAKLIMRAGRYRRIGTGTLLRQNPFSAWAQYELMAPGLLGFPTLAAFKSMYAAMLPAHNPLVQHIMENGFKRRDKHGNAIVPQVIAKGEDGRPVYRNLADLRRRLATCSSFLTLADVNGKEPIVNEDPRYVELTQAQRALYDELVKWGVAQAPGGQLTAEGALALSIRLAQVVGGFVPSDDDPEARQIDAINPKVEELMAMVEELNDQKIVIWCKFTAEIKAVVAALETQYPGAVVEYHGRMNGKEKDASKWAFIKDSAKRFFVGQQKAGGTGLDGLQGVANYMIFYSNDYPYLERLQAISRLARTDGADTVQVYDLLAQHTIDEDIVVCLKAAQDVSEAVLSRAIVRIWE